MIVTAGHDRTAVRASAKAAAGGLYTTGPDYLRFLVHSLVHGHRQFEPQVRIDDELAWGLGWGIEDSDGGRAIWQWGNDPGYKNFVIGRPADGQGVVVFTNGDRGAARLPRRGAPGPARPASLARHPSSAALAAGDRGAAGGSPASARRAGVRTVLEVRGRGDDGDVDSDHRPDRDARMLVARPGGRAVVGGPGRSTGDAHRLHRVDDRGPGRSRDHCARRAARVAPPGFARSLIFAACEQLGLRAVEAQTDAAAVPFYRATGFESAQPG